MAKQFPLRDELLPRQALGIETLLPQSRDDALRRLLWLSDQINSENIPGFAKAAELLGNWEKIRIIENPKQIVVGVVVVAIPGITLGRFRKFKKIVCVIRRDVAERSGKELAKQLIQVNLQFISQALSFTEGNAYKLESEVIDWLFGDREIGLYSASSLQINLIKENLKELSVPHATIEKDNETTILAITPAANSEIEELYWNLETIE